MSENKQSSATPTEGQDKASEVVTMRQLLECGVHFGHQTKRWDPRMKKYIFASRNGIHVIDLQQTIKLINQAYEYVRSVVRNGGTVLFVGTKKQAQEAIQVEAEKCGMPYVHHRWLGGTLTNIVTIRQSINKYKAALKQQDEGLWDTLSNKEASKRKKELVRLDYYLRGIKDMIKTPSILFIVDTPREALAVREANRLNIPIVGIVDTNGNPNEVQYPIPANDDAIRAIRLLCGVISRAVLDGQEDNVKGDVDLAKEIEQAAAESQVKSAELSDVVVEATEIADEQL